MRCMILRWLAGPNSRSVDPTRVAPTVIIRTTGNTPFFIERIELLQPDADRGSGVISWSRRKTLVRHGPRWRSHAAHKKPVEYALWSGTTVIRAQRALWNPARWLYGRGGASVVRREPRQTERRICTTYQ